MNAGPAGRMATRTASAAPLRRDPRPPQRWRALLRCAALTGCGALLGVLPLAAGAQAVAPSPGAPPVAAPPPPAAPPTREQVERRIGSVGTLIETSSGARQVESAGDAEARMQREAARAAWRDARVRFDAGDLPAANARLDEAARAMFAAIRRANPEAVGSDKVRRDFAARLDSTEALLDAFKRVSREKQTPGADRTARGVEDLLAQAKRQAAAQDLAGARVPLDQAYLTVKAAVGSQRSGDTLVRSLNFASKEEEFHYEVDRNDTHRMLVDLLLRERRANAGVDAQVTAALGAAGKLREQADAAGRRRDFAAGIGALEESTRELVRAIRGAGVYIPG